MTDRVFLDANVLVSAAITPHSRLRDLWQALDVRLLASPYVIAEARANVVDPASSNELEALLRSVAVLPAEPVPVPFAEALDLPEKDVPVLAGAVASGADALLTGDLTHFGPLMGRRVAGVVILLPGEYLRGHIG
ncbi:MAG: PIN domain-containing protein [Actinomycetia bacterium]|nr:PIN domain-containing protein [Actinomycetes bacterium]